MNNSEIFELDTSDQPLDIKTKEKKQMTAEKKKELLDRLKLGREKAKAKRDALKKEKEKVKTDTEPLLETTTDLETTTELNTTTESDVFTTVMDFSDKKEKVKKVKVKRGVVIDQNTKSKYKDYIDSRVSELINERIATVKKNRKPKDEMKPAVIEKPSIQQPPPLKPKIVEPPPRKVISTFSRRLPWMK